MYKCRSSCIDATLCIYQSCERNYQMIPNVCLFTCDVDRNQVLSVNCSGISLHGRTIFSLHSCISSFRLLIDKLLGRKHFVIIISSNAMSYTLIKLPNYCVFYFDMLSNQHVKVQFVVKIYLYNSVSGIL